MYVEYEQVKGVEKYYCVPAAGRLTTGFLLGTGLVALPSQKNRSKDDDGTFVQGS